ncbi:hypothetical protein CAS74_001590 [Pichia kudriavzevii]|uniref:Serine/threonine-protein phosphatase n=1 Tax=Pichia kudriavzevii TaxID=4909 RepID=A0A1Z8JS79_PICKU|nr:hypothetical protein CAS74_001590 [Pichia kudriavzevii]
MTSGEDGIQVQVENALKKLSIRDVFVDAEEEIPSGPLTLMNMVEIVKTVEMPTLEIPTDEQLFVDGVPDYRFLMRHFRREGKLSYSQIFRIIDAATIIMRKEPNLLKVDIPSVVVGDIHGQYYDMLGMFEMFGDPSKTQYLFLGDYVDRGDRSIEVLILLYAMKINFPKRFWLLRGNHESERMTSYFTYKRECIQRYSEELYEKSLESFKALPLCAILNEQFFCVHAGISMSLWDLEDINKIDRFKEDIPGEGLLCDLMWSDPTDDYDTETIHEDDIEHYFDSTTRDIAPSNPSSKQINFWVLLEDINHKIRVESSGFPSLITIFSAPNYCGTYANMGAALVYNGETFNIKQFDTSPAPYFLPDQMNVFEWSLPFVAEKVIEILSAILNICTEDELNKSEIILDKRSIEVLKAIDSSIAAEEEEYVSHTHDKDRRKSTTPVVRDSILKKMALVGLDGREVMHKKSHSFEDVRNIDLENEGLPPTDEERAAEEAQKERGLKHYMHM